MTEELVTLETAKLLKEKGFNEYCDLREELKKAILAGYNLYHEDFDDEK